MRNAPVKYAANFCIMYIFSAVNSWLELIFFMVTIVDTNFKYGLNNKSKKICFQYQIRIVSSVHSSEAFPPKKSGGELSLYFLTPRLVAEKFRLSSGRQLVGKRP